MSTEHDQYAKANVDFFAKVASDYDDGTFVGGHAAGDWVREMTKANYEAILSAFEWDEHSTELLDFACGTGLTTSLLAPKCQHVVGVDLSQPMLDQFRAKLDKANSDASLSSKIELVQADLLGSGQGSDKLEGRKFDIVLCTMSFHHFSDPVHATKVLSSYLKPGGKLGIVDFLDLKSSSDGQAASAASGNAHGHGGTHQHHHHGGDGAHHHEHHHGPHSGHHEHDPTEANFGAHKVKNVIAHASFRLDDFDRFFAGAGLSRSGEPKFTRTMEWPDRPAVDVYLVIGQST